MTVFVVVTLSPFGAIAITSKRFSPSSRLTVVEKSPVADGTITSSEEPVITVTTALLAVFPETINTLLLTTSSSVGWSNVKETDEEPVGVGVVREIVLVLVSGTVFVAWKR